MIPPITLSQPEEHPKGWGSELWITNNDDYCAKILTFKKGASFSMHFHWKKREHWYVVSGSLLLKYYDLTNADLKETLLGINDVIGVAAGNPHQLTALEDSVVFEVSTKHDETDSYRVLKGSSQLTPLST